MQCISHPTPQRRHEGRGGRASEGQVWPRHFAPAAPAFTRPSLLISSSAHQRQGPGGMAKTVADDNSRIGSLVLSSCGAEGGGGVLHHAMKPVGSPLWDRGAKLERLDANVELQYHSSCLQHSAPMTSSPLWAILRGKQNRNTSFLIPPLQEQWQKPKTTPPVVHMRSQETAAVAPPLCPVHVG